MRRFAPLALPALLLVLLATLATLQYRWIGQVSDLERQRMEETLRTAAAELADDFDRELARAMAYFHDPRTPGEAEGVERTVLDLERWRAEAPYPDLLGEVYRVERDGSGAFVLSCLREKERRFEPCPWPAGLEPLRQRISAHLASGHSLPLPVDASLPGLVFPTARFSSEGPPRALLVLRLDRKVIGEELLPALTQRHFGNLGSTVAVLDAKGEVIYRSGPAEGDAHSGDVSQPLFVFRPFEELMELHGLHGGRHGRKVRILHAPEGLMMKRRSAVPMELPDAPWQIVVRHRHGSLEAAVARARHHNLGISLGIVALLGVTMALLLAATRRAQRLAHQQLEFVAGVSHELNTPLAAIRSAGQNLADGVVSEDPQVRRYGDLVVREGRRLSAMVGQVLEFAGIQSGRRSYRLRPAEVAEIVDGALADCADGLAANGVRVETDVPGDLPPVMADPEALRRAVRNLVENAVKYGGSEKWVGVRARAEGREVAVTVEDRGPGIPARERSRIFEPFYRGAHAAVGNIPGSGLGLSIVRHVAAKHGGRVSVESGAGGHGSAFTIHLPAGEELGTAGAPAEVVS